MQFEIVGTHKKDDVKLSKRKDWKAEFKPILKSVATLHKDEVLELKISNTYSIIQRLRDIVKKEFSVSGIDMVARKIPNGGGVSSICFL